MYLLRLLPLTATIPSCVYSFPTTQEGPAQKPLIQPQDNLTLTPIRDALVSNKVIGDVLDDFEPTYYLDVVYPKDEIHVFLGNEIAVSELKKRPRLSIIPVPNRRLPHQNESPTFTLALTDPDATSRYNPKWSEMCHWIVTNITASAHGNNGSIDLDLEEDFAFPFVPDENSWFNQYKSRPSRCRRDGKGSKCLPGELESYFAPSPPAGTGWHRYVFVLLVGETQELQAPTHRKHWGYGLPRHGVRDWARQYGLEVVGANFFFAENEQQ